MSIVDYAEKIQSSNIAECECEVCNVFSPFWAELKANKYICVIFMLSFTVWLSGLVKSEYEQWPLKFKWL